MNARFSNKKIPAALAEAMAQSTVQVVTVCKPKKRGKVKLKEVWSGSVLKVA